MSKNRRAVGVAGLAVIAAQAVKERRGREGGGPFHLVGESPVEQGLPTGPAQVDAIVPVGVPGGDRPAVRPPDPQGALAEIAVGLLSQGHPQPHVGELLEKGGEQGFILGVKCSRVHGVAPFILGIKTTGKSPENIWKHPPNME